MTSTSQNLRPLSSLTDVAGLLTHTRFLQKEQRALRDAWFDRLALESERDCLFELEVLLKASACFASPRNHAGQVRRAPIVSRDFRRALGLFRDGMCRGVTLTRQLLGAGDATGDFRRYLELGVPVGAGVSESVPIAAQQETPEQSLVILRQGLTSVIGMLEGALCAPRIKYRTFYAALTLAKREVGRSTYFNPLLALEFRPEFDRITHSRVLDAIAGVPSDEARHLVALTFLSLFRLRRYVQLLERLALDSGTYDGREVGCAYLVLSVLRSDARALASHLRQQSGRLLGSTFERALFTATATTLVETAGQLRALGQRLIDIRGALEGIADCLHLEMRRVFAHELATLEDKRPRNELFGSLHAAIETIRPTLNNLVTFLGRTLCAEFDDSGLIVDTTSRRESSERLRRDLWVLGRVVRSFATKAEAPQNFDRWSVPGGLSFVRKFLACIRAIGFPVLQASAYPRREALIEVMMQLEGSDPLPTTTLARTTQECRSFHGFLIERFHEVSRCSELSGVPFDEWAVESVLGFYLSE